METRLSPSQERVFRSALFAASAGHLVVVRCGQGMGKTIILQELHRVLGGALLTMDEWMRSLQTRHPLAIEEAFLQMVGDALVKHGAVIVDDLHLVEGIVDHCGNYPRAGLLDPTLLVLTAQAAAAGRRLVFASSSRAPSPVRQRAYTWGIDEFEVADYEFLCRAYLGEGIAGLLDFAKIHRFAPRLDGHQLKGACVWLRQQQEELLTEDFLDYLRSQHLISNVNLQEVQQVSLEDLKGIDDIIQSLEANVVLPLENDALATELRIQPKRGILLAGPPGTGKTTIGRALAHRLKGKFFLVDGTFIARTSSFYERLAEVFEAAQQNSPSVIFIDDSDVIFENDEDPGLYRYLLTMLDGLESKSARRVCVMMTAMNVANLPGALVRSGRIDLWLETRLPDEDARTAILQRLAAELPQAMEGAELPALVAATHGLTGADLKRIFEDGKILFAYDKASGKPLGPPAEYFLTAIRNLRADKQRYRRPRRHSERESPNVGFQYHPVDEDQPVI